MSLDTSFLNINRGSRLSSFLGLQMTGTAEYRFAPDYTYVEIPTLGFWNPSEEKLTEKALRNQYVRLYPACMLDVRGTYKVEVQPNPQLAEFGLYQPGYYVEPGSGILVPGIYLNPRKDIEMSDIDYAVRLYLRT